MTGRSSTQKGKMPWFKAFPEDAFDPRIAEAAGICGCTVERAVAVLWLLMALASNNDPRGSVIGIRAGTIAAALRITTPEGRPDAESVNVVIEALGEAGAIGQDGMLADWDEKQAALKDPTAAERQQRCYNRKKAKREAEQKAALPVPQAPALVPVAVVPAAVAPAAVGIAPDVPHADRIQDKGWYALDGVQEYLEEARVLVAEAAGVNPDDTRMADAPVRIVEWLRAGCDLAEDILPTVAGITQRKGSKHINYFRAAVLEAQQERSRYSTQIANTGDSRHDQRDRYPQNRAGRQSAYDSMLAGASASFDYGT
jgi:hypothetical protein